MLKKKKKKWQSSLTDLDCQLFAAMLQGHGGDLGEGDTGTLQEFLGNNPGQLFLIHMLLLHLE